MHFTIVTLFLHDYQFPELYC